MNRLLRFAQNLPSQDASACRPVLASSASSSSRQNLRIASIFLNAPQPSERELQRIYRHSRLRIAADGGAWRLREAHLEPDLVMGDMDSSAEYEAVNRPWIGLDRYLLEIEKRVLELEEIERYGGSNVIRVCLPLKLRPSRT